MSNTRWLPDLPESKVIVNDSIQSRKHYSSVGADINLRRNAITSPVTISTRREIFNVTTLVDISRRSKTECLFGPSA